MDQHDVNDGKPCEGAYFQLTRLYTYVLPVILYALVTFHKQSTSVLSKDISITYGVDENKLTIFSSIYFYIYACTQPFAGLFADLVDPAIVIGCFSLIAAIGSIICGLSNSLGVGIFGRLLVGLGCGPTYVSTCRVITNWYKLSQLPIMMGILVAASAAGGILAALPLSLFAQKYGWKPAMYGIGGIGCVLSVLVLIFVRGNPITKGFRPVNEQLSSTNEGIPFKEKMKLLWVNFKTVLVYGYFWVVTLFNVASSAPYFNVAGYWGGPYLTSVLGYSPKDKGTTFLSISIGLIIGSLLLPNISTWCHTKKWVLAVSTLIALGVSIPFCIVGDTISNGAIWALFTFFGMCTAPMISVSYPLMCSYYHPKVAGSAVGLGNFFIFMAAAIYQQLAGLGFRYKDANGKTILDWYGFKWGLWAFTCISLGVALILAIVAKEAKFPEPAELDNKEKEEEMNKDVLENEKVEDEDSGSGVNI